MPLPSRVLKYDGRLEPFDGDEISRDVYAATEFLGRPNPYLARQLADGVLHFLAADGLADPTPIGDVIDATVKVIRELGHPLLARAFQDRARVAEPGPPAEPHSFLPPDLAAACRDGLLTFLGPTSPTKILATTVTPPSGGSDPAAWADAVAEASNRVGHLVAVDGPEWALDDDTAERWAETLIAALRANGLAAVINLNVAEPPVWTDRMPQMDPGTRLRVTDRLLPALLDDAHAKVRVDWHLTRSDFVGDGRASLRRIAARVVAGDAIAFVAHKRHRPVTLAEGLDRRYPTLLAAFGVGLPRLLEIIGPEAADLSGRLGTVARLAIAAGRAFRDSLRRAGGPAVREFLLERSRLLVVPTGLDEVVQFLADASDAHDDTTISAQKILLSLNAALLREMPRLSSVLDVPPFEVGVSAAACSAEEGSPAFQLNAASRLHAALGGGTSTISLPQEIASDPDAIVNLLEFASRQPGLGRFRLCPATRRYRQLTAGW
jgi:hypothetical protein